MTLEEELDLLRMEYLEKENAIREKYLLANNSHREITPDCSSFVNFKPLADILNERKITFKDLSELSGVSKCVLVTASTGTAFPKTDKIAKIARTLNVPISNIIEFTGYKCKKQFENRFGFIEPFDPPESSEGLVTYKPLRDLVHSFYADKTDKKTIQDLYDKLPRIVYGDDTKRMEAITKALSARGLEIKDRDSKKRPGLSQHLRTKINKDEPVTIRVIYEICKLLQCNVDFVMGWK